MIVNDDSQIEMLRRINEVISTKPEWRFGFSHYELVDVLIESGDDAIFTDNLENTEGYPDGEIPDEYLDDVLDLLMGMAAIGALDIYNGGETGMKFKPTQDGYMLMRKRLNGESI